MLALGDGPVGPVCGPGWGGTGCGAGADCGWLGGIGCAPAPMSSTVRMKSPM